MPRAAVRDSELDLSTRVPSFPGVYGAIVIPAKKGPVGVPVLVSSDSDFLRKFTPSEKVEVGYDVSHFSALAFLQKSDKLWVSRAAKNPLFGGCVIRTNDSTLGNHSLVTGLADPTAFTFNASADQGGATEQVSITLPAGTTFDVDGAGKFFRLSSPTTDYYVWFAVSDGDPANNQQDPNVTGATAVPVLVSKDDTDVQVAVKVATALALLADWVVPTPTTATLTATCSVIGDAADATANTSGGSVAVVRQGVDAIHGDEECMFLYGLNPGDWNNDISISLITDQLVVKEPDAFIIRVFKESVQVEEFMLSRVRGKKDGYNVNIYAEDRIQSSNYVRILNNPGIPSDTAIKAQSAALPLVGGTDGSAVGDADMITAAARFHNKADVFFTLIMDGGWATPAYQLELDTIAVTRRDCVAILSVPYSAEAGSDTDYLNNVIDYRKTILNLNSSWSALYSPHCKVYDRFNDRNLFVSPDGYAAAVISATAANFELWYPPAGWRRGLVKVLDLRRRYTDTDMDLLADNGINPLRFVPGKGIVVWGQKTLLARPSALDRLNVRLMIVAVIPSIKEALEDFEFEFNDTATQGDISSILNRAVDRVKTGKGVYSFSVVCDSSNNTPEDIDNYRLNIDLFLSPSKAVEDIRLRTIITKTGVDFVV